MEEYVISVASWYVKLLPGQQLPCLRRGKHTRWAYVRLDRATRFPSREEAMAHSFRNESIVPLTDALMEMVG